MRILFVIPHYFGGGPRIYGSTDPCKRNDRITALQECIAAIHQNIGINQTMLSCREETDYASTSLHHDVHVAVCTTPDHHLLHDIPIDPGYYHQHIFPPDSPQNLGFCCYSVMKEHYGYFDWYCYLEDDLVIKDPLFFEKLSYFNAVANNIHYLLLPNRFELQHSGIPIKCYIDGKLWENNQKIMERLRLPNCKREICLPYGSSPDIRMTPADNPHSGCFFLEQRQLKLLLDQPWYGQPVSGLAGPLESAATLPIMAVFNIFKPAIEHASFLEIHHHHQRYMKNHGFPAKKRSTGNQ